MADNWYVVLELEFDPPVEDENKILQRIDEKSKFWSTHFNDFKNGAQYRTWHQSIPQIKKDMLGENNIRKKLAADACTIVYAPIDKLLKTIGRKGNITSDEGDKISKKLKVNVSVIKKRATKLGLEWITATDYQAIYDKYYKTKPQNSSTFDGMKQMLITFNVDNLYDFLYAGTSVKNANKLPCETLRQRAKEKKKNEYYKNDNVSGTGSKLCGQCDLAFKDDNSKQIYDNYLEYSKRKAILDEAKSIAEISGELTSEQGDEVVGQLTQLFRDRKLSEKVLISFCKIEKINYNASGSESKNTNIKVCRCGCINDVSDGRKVCSNCGLPLSIKCPKCGTISDSNIRVCKCGFKFENIDKAIALCEQAEHSIDSLEFNIAEAHLTDAERYWPGSEQVSELRKKLSDFKNRVGSEVSKMRSAISNKRYFEAKKQYETIKKLFAGYSDLSIEEEIKNAIAKAQALFNRVKASKIEKDILELCAQAYDLCNDLPGVRDLMPAPSAVTGFKVVANPSSRANNIFWNVNNDRSIRYIIVRSQNGWIQNTTDGEVIFRGSASSYADKQIEPGVVYYYNVFAERAGILSKGAQGEFKEIYNLFEISNVNVAASDTSLNITWDRLPRNSTAEIFQVENSVEKHIISCPSDSYLIANLINDKQYTYHVALSYIISGKKEYTKGVITMGTPTKPPQPIETLRIKPQENNVFDAVWEMTENDEIRLYSSSKKPTHIVGDVISLGQIESEMKQLQKRPLTNPTRQSLKPTEQGCSFQYNGDEVLYVVAVIVKSGSVVFGSVARASNGDNVTVKSIRPVNGKINIYLDVPKDATGFVVLYRHDKFPTDISDVQTIRKYVHIKQYQLNSAILIDNLEEKKYYFSVFAEFKHDGESDYSSGTDYLFDNSAKVNITYSISVSKKLLGEKSVTLEFEADVKSFTLPEIEVMSAIGNTPMFKSSATLFYTIPSQAVDGTLQVKIPIPKSMKRDIFIKAFFKDESAQSGNQLRLKLGSNYKIS